jgi:multidrug resistance efflux pump
MDICCPKDGFVTKVLVMDGKQVLKNTLLLQIDSELEDRMMDRVATREATRAIRAAQFTGEQLQLLKTIAQLGVDMSTESLREIQRNYDLSSRLAIAGSFPEPNLRPMEHDLTMAKLALTRAQAQAKQLEYAATRHQQIDRFAKALSDSEKQFILDKKKRLGIVAPSDGKLRLLVAEGSFAELGSVLLRLA